MIDSESDIRPSIEGLYRSAYRVSVKYAARLVGQTLAEDVAQETFLRLLRYKSDAAERLTLSLVLTVTRNVAMTMVARRTPAPAGDTMERYDRADDGPRGEPDASRLVRGLPGPLYEAFVMTEVRGLSERQASLALSQSRSVIGEKRRTAIRVLREDAAPTGPGHRMLAAG